MIRMHMKRRIAAILCILLLAAFTGSAAAASEPYRGYIYDSYGHSVDSLNGYAPVRLLTNADLGITPLKNPQDLFVDKHTGQVYLLDSGNNRIIMLDRDLNYIKEISQFTRNGETTALNLPSSIFVKKDGTLVVADTGNDRVIFADQQGEILSEVTKPESEIYPQNIKFAPVKVLCDDSDNLYVIVKGLFQGAVVFNKDGEFERFYGSNKVKLSLQLLRDLFWKSIMSAEQKSGMSNYVPIEFKSFDIDDKGFIYTVTQDNDVTKTLSKRNSLGENIIKAGRKFGDLESIYDRRSIITQFIDVCVDENYFTYALDLTRGRVFQYDSEFNLVTVFGGYGGDQVGTFKLPVAVDVLDGQVLVLDADMGTVTTFALTSFGEKVNRALKLYNEGKYLEAIEPWWDVVELNNNYLLAHKGIGDGLYMTGDYIGAMKHYKIANEKDGYLKAFREQRNIFLRRYFAVIFIAVILLLIGLAVMINRRNRRRRP